MIGRCLLRCCCGAVPQALVYEMLQSDMRLAGLSPPTPAECNKRISKHMKDPADLLLK